MVAPVLGQHTIAAVVTRFFVRDIMIKKYRLITCIIIIILFVVAGLVFMTDNGDTYYYFESNGRMSQCSVDDEITVRFTGNDLVIYQIDVKTPEPEILKNATFLWGSPNRDLGIQYEPVSPNDVKVRGDGLVVSVPRTKMIYGRDYYFLIDLKSCQDVESVRFFVSKEAQSTFINGDLAQQGISLWASCSNRYNPWQMVFKVIFLVLPVLTLLSYMGITTSKYEAVTLYLIGASFLLYLFGVLNLLPVGVIVLYAIGLVAFLYLLYLLFRLDQIGLYKLFVEGFLPSLLVTIFMIGMVYFLDYTYTIRVWDDFWQWALSPKLMYMFDRFPIHAKSTLANDSYLPIYSVFQYGALSVNGRFSETILFMAKHFLEMGFIFGCLSDTKKKRWIAPFALCLFIMASEELFFSQAMFDSLYVDILLGIVLGYVLVKLYVFLCDSSRKNAVLLFLGAAYLSMLKDSGWVTDIIFIGLLFLCLLIFKGNRKRIGLSMAIMAMALLLTQFSWRYYVRVQTNAVMQASTVMVDDEIRGESLQLEEEILQKSDVYVVSDTDVPSDPSTEPPNPSEELTSESNSETTPVFSGTWALIKRHIKKMLIGKDYPNQLFSLSFVMWCIVLAFIYFLIMWRSEKRFADKAFFILLPGLGILEVAFMQIAYLTVFLPQEAEAYVSEERYLGSVLLALLIFVVYSALGRKSRMKIIWWPIALTCLLILTAESEKCNAHLHKRGDTWSNMRTLGQKIRKVVGEEESIYYLSQYDDGFSYIRFAYETAPTRISPLFRVENGIVEQRVYPVLANPGQHEYTASQEGLYYEVSGYSYMYIGMIDEGFKEAYGEILVPEGDSNILESESLYRVLPGESGNLRLTKIRLENL